MIKNYNKEETMEGKVESFEILESHCADEVKIEFDPFKFEIVERDNVYYVVKKQPQYPKTYSECAKLINCFSDAYIDGYKGELLDKFQELLICRDAYWNIAGDWKPNLDSKQHKFAITNVGNKISFEVYGEYNSILCFPTAEMRDAFYENFKDLIENCKELL